jgi:hypothetical protein
VTTLISLAVTDSPAFFAAPRPVTRLNVDIVRIGDVVEALSALGASYVGTISPHQIFAPRAWLKMLGVDTTSHSANVIKVEAPGDWTDSPEIRRTMRECGAFYLPAGGPVSVGEVGTGPQPASASGDSVTIHHFFIGITANLDDVTTGFENPAVMALAHALAQSSRYAIGVVEVTNRWGKVLNGGAVDV